MTAQVKLYASIIALIAVVAAFVASRAHWRADGARAAEVAQLKRTTAAQAVTITADSQRLAKIDTVKVFRQVVKSDTVLQRLIDSAIVHHTDTVMVTREVLVEAKATIDSTKKAADACCQLARDWKAKALSSDSLVHFYQVQIPSVAKPWLDRGEGVLACVGAVWLAGKLKAP